MARADLIIQLVQAALSGDEVRVRNVVEAMAAEERRKRHPLLAEELGQLLDRPGLGSVWSSASTAVSNASGVLEIHPKLRLQDLLLPEIVRNELSMLIEEQHRVELLRAYNLEPRNRVLLVGPPGNGKTSCAEALATELAVPLLILRYESVITSYLGETSAKLHAVLEDARRRHCVLFIDEFDTLAKERGDEHDSGEIKRIVSTLLLQIDRLPSHVVVCAATNHSELLDRAVWRRFQVRLELPNPSKSERVKFASILAERLRLRSADLSAIVSQIGPTSFAELEELFLELRRRQVLSQESGKSDRLILKDVLAAYESQAGRTRKRPTRLNPDSHEQDE